VCAVTDEQIRRRARSPGPATSSPALRSVLTSFMRAKGSRTTPLPMTAKDSWAECARNQLQHKLLTGDGDGCAPRCAHRRSARQLRNCPRAHRQSCLCPHRPTGRREPPRSLLSSLLSPNTRRRLRRSRTQSQMMKSLRRSSRQES